MSRLSYYAYAEANVVFADEDHATIGLSMRYLKASPETARSSSAGIEVGEGPVAMTFRDLSSAGRFGLRELKGRRVSVEIRIDELPDDELNGLR